MKIPKYYLMLAALTALGIPAASQGASIGFQFYENTTRGQETILNGTEPTAGTVNLTAGVAAVAQNNWNSITGPTDSRGTPITASSLIDNTGTATGASISVLGYLYGGSANFSSSDPNQTGDNKLADNQMLSLWGATASVQINNIPYALYDIYVYLACDNSSRTGTLSDGTTTYTYLSSIVGDNGTSQSEWTANPNSTTLGSTYLEFTGETASSLQITDIVVGNGGFGGIQIVEVVPEPGTLALLGLSAVSLGAFGRRLRAERKS